jgi:hypothetical protein
MIRRFVGGVRKAVDLDVFDLDVLADMGGVVPFRFANGRVVGVGPAGAHASEARRHGAGLRTPPEPWQPGQVYYDIGFTFNPDGTRNVWEVTVGPDGKATLSIYTPDADATLEPPNEPQYTEHYNLNPDAQPAQSGDTPVWLLEAGEDGPNTYTGPEWGTGTIPSWLAASLSVDDPNYDPYDDPAQNPQDSGNEGSDQGDGEGGEGSGAGCVAAETFVLMDDGGARRIKDIARGDRIRTIGERHHESEPSPTVIDAEILAVHRHEGAFPLVGVQGIKATRAHRWAVKSERGSAFAPTSGLSPNATYLRSYAGGTVQWTPLLAEPTASETAPTVFNVTTTAGTFFVAAYPDGPWYLVHNTKDANEEDDGGEDGAG